MFKKDITYTDFNGVERTESFYFNLSEAELVELQTSMNDGYDLKLKEIISAKNTPDMIKTFKELIKMSYGVKSSDGRRFIKNQEVWEEFEQSPAYSELFVLLATNSNEAEKFVTGVIPDVEKLLEKIEANRVAN